ncbi:UNVERIFIED_CONTAM: hypothetical protein FKN15_005539 [Acipenser sinensis]
MSTVEESGAALEPRLQALQCSSEPGSSYSSSYALALAPPAPAPLWLRHPQLQLQLRSGSATSSSSSALALAPPAPAPLWLRHPQLQLRSGSATPSSSSAPAPEHSSENGTAPLRLQASELAPGSGAGAWPTLVYSPIVPVSLTVIEGAVCLYSLI